MRIYFLDGENNVYDDKGQVVGKIGVNGLVINEENKLVYNGNIVGVIGGNLTDLERSNDMNKEISKVRTLKKNNNAGFGQIMIVGLVLLCLGLFIAVIVLSLFS